MSSMTFRVGFRRDPSLKEAQIWTIWEWDLGLGGGCLGGEGGIGRLESNWIEI